jgi:hypothetical protein
VADKPVKKQSRKNQHAQLRRKWRTDGTYERLLAEQKGMCGICGAPPIDGQKFDIDHHHAKGKDDVPRGLIHRGCNLRLGRESSAWWLYQAASYLRRTA